MAAVQPPGTGLHTSQEKPYGSRTGYDHPPASNNSHHSPHQQQAYPSNHSTTGSSFDSSSAPINPILEPKLHNLANDAAITDAYNSLTAQVNAQNDAVNRIVQSQQSLQQQQASTLSSDRAAVEDRLARVEDQIRRQTDDMRVIKQNQDHIIRLFQVQKQVLEQERLIRAIADQQQRALQMMQPVNASLDQLAVLQANQHQLLRGMGSVNLQPTAGVTNHAQAVGSYNVPTVVGGTGPSGVEQGHQLHDTVARSNWRIDGDAVSYVQAVRAHMGPTIIPYVHFDADTDAKALRKAMRGLGTNERVVVDIIANRTRQQRLEIARAYSTNYRRDLVKDFRSEMGGKLRQLLVSLVCTRFEAEAIAAHDSIQGMGTDEESLILVLADKTATEMEHIRRAYSELFSRDLVADIRSDTSGWFCKYLVALAEGKREEDSRGVNFDLAQEDASSLYEAGESRMGTDEKVFVEIFSTRSLPQLAAIATAYAKLSDNDLSRAIEKETSFNFRRALQATLAAATNRAEHYARALKTAMDGVGHNAVALIYILSTRAEIDLMDIITSYRSLHEGDLYERVRSETRFDYRRLCLELFGDALFDPAKDAKMLRKAMRGLGTNEKMLNRIIGGRSSSQRAVIATEFEKMYQRNLAKDVNSEVGGDYRWFLLALLKDPDEFVASEVQRAIRGLGTDDRSLIEIICTRDAAEMKRLKDKYQELYGVSLAEAIRSDTSGNYCKLLCSMVENTRREDEPVNQERAREEAARLYAAGEDRMGTDEDAFITVFSTHSFPMLQVIFEHYAKLCDYEISKSIKRETSFNFKRALITIVRAVREYHDFFAEEFENTMKGIGTKDYHLVRLMVMHCEKDLDLIAEAYHRRYKRTLESRIHSDTSGSYRHLFLRVLDKSRGWCTNFAQRQKHLSATQHVPQHHSRMLYHQEAPRQLRDALLVQETTGGFDNSLPGSRRGSIPQGAHPPGSAANLYPNQGLSQGPARNQQQTQGNSRVQPVPMAVHGTDQPSINL